MMAWLLSLPGAVAQGLFWGVMAIGVYITYKILDIADLTVDGSIVTGGAVCAMLVTNGVNVWLAVIAAFAAGLLAGLLTGLMHTLLGIPAILSGILTQRILWSVNLLIMGMATVALPARQFDILVAPIKIESSLAVLAGLVIVVGGALYWFFGTELGVSLRATGCNQHMSRAQGINTNFTKVLGLMLSNGIVALAGAFYAQYQGAISLTSGTGSIVIGLAAIVIGEAIVSSLSSNFAVRLLGVVAGSTIYFLVYQTIIFLGIDSKLLQMLSAGVVGIFLAVPYVKKQLRLGRKRGKKNA